MKEVKTVYWADAVRAKRRAENDLEEFFYQLDAQGGVMVINPEIVKELRKNKVKVVKKTIYLAFPNQSN